MVKESSVKLKLREQTVLPRTPKQEAKLDSLIAFYEELWTKGPCDLDVVGYAQLRLYLALMIDNGFPSKCALAVIANLPSSNDRPTDVIFVPVYPRQSEHFTQLTLSKIPLLSLRILQHQLKLRPNLSLYSYPKQIERALSSTFKRMKSNGRTRDLSFRDLATLAPYLSVLTGVPPFQISVLAQEVRPTSQPQRKALYSLLGVSNEHTSHWIKTGLDIGSKPRPIKSVKEQLEFEFAQPSTWIGQGRSLLRELCERLKSVSGNRLRTPRQRNKAKKIVEETLQEAHKIAPTDSIISLAIKYISKIYIEKASVNANTVRTYLDRAVINGFMRSEESYSMSDWEPDDFYESIEERLFDPRLNQTSHKLIVNAYLPLIAFIVRELKLPKFSTKNLRREVTLCNSRWLQISPHRFDKAVSELSVGEERAIQSAAIALLLGYYGGLRIGEVRRLTLDNIVYRRCTSELDIEILNGKTAYARRRVPLSDLAPDYVINLIINFANKRRLEFPARSKLSGIPLFGKEGDARYYTYSSFTRFCHQIVHSLFGEETTFHMLRHNFCSLLFVRWYEIKHAGFRKSLRDQSHAIFQPTLQARLREYFELARHEDSTHTPYDLVLICKLTGHSSPGVLFQYYIHTFSEVQAHIARNLDSHIGDLRLTGSKICGLVPKAAGSATRAKIGNPGETVLLQELAQWNSLTLRQSLARTD